MLVLDGARRRRAGTTAPSGRSGDDLAVARELHRARLAQEGSRVRGEEHLVRPDADDERDLVAGADEQAGVVAMDDDEREVSFELAEREPDGLDEIALVVALDEVRDGLGVGLGRERVAVGGEALLQLAVVLDDAVEDDRELRGVAAGERVRVRLGDAAVCRPARVRRDPSSTVEPFEPARAFRLPSGPTART